ncbi:MAG: hypothetical protein C5B51_14775 [Terriglobia bacterium]|nr:MAG: hypothetical protein C5B51_14775 [Terriglobia bacterium]
MGRHFSRSPLCAYEPELDDKSNGAKQFEAGQNATHRINKVVPGVYSIVLGSLKGKSEIKSVFLEYSMAGLIIPKTYVAKLDSPVIFLAGPLKTSSNWQDDAVDVLFSLEKNLSIVSPRKGVREGIANYIVSGDDYFFPRPRAWERHYLDVASREGAVMFWLPGEAMHNHIKVYGAMTWFELGHCIADLRRGNNPRFCIGSDGHFPEIDILQYDLSIEAPEMSIKKTLDATCFEAIQIACR